MGGPKPLMARGTLVAVVSVFIVSRIALAWLADHPHFYGSAHYDVTGDVSFYEDWARRIVNGRQFPYGEVRIEYPPGVLPFILTPRLTLPDNFYRQGLGALFMATDAAGLAGLLSLAGRQGSMLGPWMWVVLLPLLGPIVYCRLDIVPAVATIWAVERGASERWFSAGGFVGLGALAKLYPALLVPVIVTISPRRAAFLGGLAAVIAAGLVPFAGVLRALWDAVIGYHVNRGIEVESLWGLGLLASSHFGYSISVVKEFGAEHIRSDVSAVLKTIGVTTSLAVLSIAMVVAARSERTREPSCLALLLFGTLTLVTGVGTVFSPQYVLWIIALGTATACSPQAPARSIVVLLVPIALLTQALFPFLYEEVLKGQAGALLVLAIRNVLVLCAGIAALSAIARHHYVGRSHATAGQNLDGTQHADQLKGDAFS